MDIILNTDDEVKMLPVNNSIQSSISIKPNRLYVVKTHAALDKLLNLLSAAKYRLLESPVVDDIKTYILRDDGAYIRTSSNGNLHFGSLSWMSHCSEERIEIS